MFAQGDVLLVLVDKKFPTATATAVTASADGRLVLAYGEATGHHHSFAFSDRVALFREDGAGGGLFLTVSGYPAALEHQEHQTIDVPPGTYKVLRQRTYQAGMVRQVED